MGSSRRGPTQMAREIAEIPAVVERTLGTAPPTSTSVAARDRAAGAPLRPGGRPGDVGPRRDLRPVPGRDHARHPGRPRRGVRHHDLPGAAPLGRRPARRGLAVRGRPGRGRGGGGGARRREPRPSRSRTSRPPPLAAAAELVLPLHAGEERAVAATKTYVASLAVVAGLVARLAGAPRRRGTLGVRPGRPARRAGARPWRSPAPGCAAPGAACVDELAGRGRGARRVARPQLRDRPGGRPQAQGDRPDLRRRLLHRRPPARAGGDRPARSCRPSPSGPTGRPGSPSTRRSPSLGAAGRSPGRSAAARWPGGDHALVVAPGLPEPLTPLAFVLPGFLLAEATARARGRDPDAPPGLTKVTRTR